MIIRCAWCKCIIGSKPPFGDVHDEETTNGICDTCYHAELESWETFKIGEGKPDCSVNLGDD